MASPAVTLFVYRARAVRPGFCPHRSQRGGGGGDLRRLDGLPLAIELAPARTRLLDPATLLDRLAASLDALGTGAVDLPERQRTLRATVEWSVVLLPDAERSLLEVTAVFMDGWTIQAASQVAGLDEDRALELSEALARHSLVYLDSTELGPRLRMLETVREFVAERLAARPTPSRSGAATPPITGRWRSGPTGRCGGPGRASGPSGCRPRRATWPPPCAGTWPTTVNRCRTCSASFGSSGIWRTTSARSAPGSGSCSPPPTLSIPRPAPSCCGRRRDGRRGRRRPRGALGQPAPGTAAGRDRQPLPPGLCASRPSAWTSAIAGDVDSALREASASLAGLRGQDEPVWTALAGLDLGGGGDPRPLRRRPASSDRNARPDEAVRRRLARRLLLGVLGRPSAGAGPPAGGQGAAGRGTGSEPGGPEHPQRDLVPGRIGPVGTRVRRPRVGGTAGGCG